ncbi:MAG: helix-turn-helix domain-containing protein [Hyphomicrobiaceae bacterium]
MKQQVKPPKKAPDKSNLMEIAIGRQARGFRQMLNLTIPELSRSSGLSPGMLSKIETGAISPSLTTLQTLANALNVPVTSLFQKYEEEREAIQIRSGLGPVVNRQGSKHGLVYHYLGHPIKRSRVSVDPCLVSIKDRQPFTPVSLQHTGVEFIMMIEGELIYRHGQKLYHLKRDDTLFFDGDISHGPERAIVRPIKFLSIIVQPRFGD